MAIHAESSFNVLSYAAALFFVVAVSHVGLRSELQAAHVVYLEHAYIVLYVVLLVVSVNSILFYSDISLPMLHYKSNLIPKLLYWPVITGVLLWVTLSFFYPDNPATSFAEKAKQLSTPSFSGWVDRIVSSDVFTTTHDHGQPTATPTDPAIYPPDTSLEQPDTPQPPATPADAPSIRPVPPGVPQPPASPINATETTTETGTPQPSAAPFINSTP
jgi:hypothetical protein